MSIVTLVSGGLDSSLLVQLTMEQGIEQFPLFIDYGQLGREKEWTTCKSVLNSINAPKPKKLNIQNYGKFYPSGITDPSKLIFEEAFLPGRNLMFILAGAAHAYQTNSEGVSIGLLDEQYSIFPDQRRSFVSHAEALISEAMGRKIIVSVPLMSFSKAEVIKLAHHKGISGTYSCHAGTELACGKCIACLEFNSEEES